MKKLLSILLALMMFSVPSLSMAEELEDLGDLLIGGSDGPTSMLVTDEIKFPGELAEAALAAGRRVNNTLSFTGISGMETGDPTMDTAIADLFKALALRISQQGDEADLALQISGQDALTMGFAANGEDVYIKSNLLGGTIVVSADEIVPLINRLLDMLVLMEAMTEADAADLREQMSMMAEAFESTMASTMESVMAMEDLAALNTAAIEKLFTTLEAKVEMVDVGTVPKMCDPAAEAAMIVLNNEDMAALMKGIYQFLLDNPVLLDYLSSMMGMPTEAQLDQMWETNGEVYKAYGLYETEEEYRADNMTFKQIVETEMAELDGRKVLDGEFTLMLAADESGAPVWATMSLPMYMESDSLVDEAQPLAETTQIDATYTRQTVAQGMAHTCNITIDGETLSIDVLAGDDSMTINMGGVDSQGNIIKLLEIAIRTGESQTLPAGQTLAVEATLYDGEDVKVMDVLLDGECEFTDVRSYFGGKLTLTIYEEYDGVQTANAMVIDLKSDYAINGVDFSGMTELSFDVAGVHMGMQVVSETADPEASIMSGDVVRPAELDDNAFSNWFVRVINSLSAWLNNVIVMLPESVLTMIVSLGM